jgi:hypothetical protein
MNINKFKAIYVVSIILILGVIGVTLLQQFFMSSGNNAPVASEDNPDKVENNVDEKVVIDAQRDLFQETKGVVAEEKNSANTTNSTGSLSTNTTTKPKTVTKPTPTPTPNPTPSPTSCPQSTQNCVPCNKADGNIYCRLEPGKTTGYKGWSCQNNNPGNIRYSSSRINLITGQGGPKPCGERVDSRGGTYMIFKTYSEGRNGLKAYLKAINAGQHSAYSDCADGICSLSYVFSKYAPGDPNYAKNIADKLGVPVTTNLSWVIANKFEQFIDAIQVKEGWFIR